jgi:ribonuclease P protein component
MKSSLVSLKKNEDFKSLLSGKKVSNKYSTIFFKRLSNKDTKKLNLSIVTKKKIGNAVVRNKIKRRLRNIMNDIYKQIKINLNFSYLIIARKNVSSEKYQDIKTQIFKDFGRIR